MANQLASAPKYLWEFSCLADQCPDHCCAGWTVSVDKKTFKALRQAPNAELVEKVKRHIPLVAKPTPEFHASVSQDTNGQCVFLDPNRLCEIQANLGAQSLPRTCQDYPRHYYQIGAGVEMQAVLSCPAIASNVLLDSDAFVLADHETDFAPNKKLPGLKGFNQIVSAQDPLKRHFGLIRDYVVGVVRNRGIPIWMRVVFVGFLAKRLDAVRQAQSAQDQDIQLSSALLSLDESLRNGAFAESLSGLEDPTQGVLRQEIIQDLSMARLSMAGLTLGGVTSAVFLKAFAKSFEGFSFREGDLLGNAERFAQCERAYFKPFENRHPVILENYLIHQILCDLFPSALKSPTDQWVQIVARYAMVRFYLIGLAGAHKDGLNQQHAVDLIYSFTRAVQHSSQFLEKIEATLREKGMNNLGTMAMLVRGPSS